MMPLDIFEICCRADNSWTDDDKTLWRGFLETITDEEKINIAMERSMKFPDTVEPVVEPVVEAVVEAEVEAVVEADNGCTDWPEDGVPDDDRQCKMVIVGDGAIGKSCLLDTLMGIDEVDWDAPEYKPTAAMNFSVDWDWNDQGWAVELWDTAGQEALRTLRLTAYDSCNVFVIGYDMCRKTSLENVPDWVEEIHDTYDQEFGIILVGTKYDMWLERVEEGHEDVVTEEEVASMAQEIDAVRSIFTSAKDGHGLVREDDDDGNDLQSMILDVCAKGRLEMDMAPATAPVSEPAPEPAPEPEPEPEPTGTLKWPAAGNDALKSSLCTCKAVVVGDGAVGKTCLLDRVTGTDAVDWENPEYVPTAAANQEVDWEYEDMEFAVELWDTAGQEALGALRAIAYPDSNVFMLTYDMSRKTSLENIPDWKEEIEYNCDDYSASYLWVQSTTFGRRGVQRATTRIV